MEHRMNLISFFVQIFHFNLSNQKSVQCGNILQLASWQHLESVNLKEDFCAAFKIYKYETKIEPLA